MGDKSKPLENYRYILGRQEADFLMPRHCHTFEQIRLPLVGDMNLGEQGILREGEVGYFPEGQTYGPQDDPIGTPKQVQLVLQFAGASGLGMQAGRGRGPTTRRHRPSGASAGRSSSRGPATTAWSSATRRTSAICPCPGGREWSASASVRTPSAVLDRVRQGRRPAPSGSPPVTTPVG